MIRRSRSRSASMKTFLRGYLKWFIMDDERTTQMSNILLERIKVSTTSDEGEGVDWSKFSYRFVKYSRYNKRLGKMVFGLALVGWRWYEKYRVMPNLFSYFEVDTLDECNKAIDAIMTRYNELIEANVDFINQNWGLFVIPRNIYLPETKINA